MKFRRNRYIVECKESQENTLNPAGSSVEIDTLWNVKTEKLIVIAMFDQVEIDTLWNVKHGTC